MQLHDADFGCGEKGSVESVGLHEQNSGTLDLPADVEECGGAKPEVQVNHGL